MKYSGIDLHSNNSVVTVTDDADRVVAEKRLPNDLPKILAFLAPWKAELAGVVVESTFNWYWLVDGLQAAGFIVHLANTTAIRKYDGLKHSGDETDARYLAHLLRLGILPMGTILPPEARSVRDLARKRMQLVRSRTSHILAVENITARQFGTRITSNQVKRLDELAIDQMHLQDDVALAIRTNVAVITTLSAQIDVVEKRLQEKVASNPQLPITDDCSWYRPGPRNRHPAGNRNHRAFCQRRQLRLVCAVRGQPAHEQRQKERRR
ncbi:transposase [Tardiphaga sp.]|uniref:IS110 family transposase n=1 Tax=Tardiphaga sp. TaxID=1926292 RepID=UPI002628365B|nr:transposase [Tardiphaga sp.]MDB5621428.1 Transposase family protein [Tardiphaga sp.]